VSGCGASAVAIIFSIFSTCQSAGCGYFRSAGNAALDADFDDNEEAGLDGLNDALKLTCDLHWLSLIEPDSDPKFADHAHQTGRSEDQPVTPA
jgi:hypothetical protein